MMNVVVIYIEHVSLSSLNLKIIFLIYLINKQSFIN
jgi:hypothetical protein